MSRTKKSRKPGTSSASMPKPKLKASDKPTDKKPKKKSGHVAGNRQLEASNKKKDRTSSQQNKDPRIGSKKPIVLTKADTSTSTKQKDQNKTSQPIPAVRKIDQTDIMRNRMIAIEEDEKLLAIIAKQDEDITLNEQEIDYFNDLMDEHAKLCDILGISDDDEEEAPSQRSSLSEDDLWDKLDGSDLSKFIDDEDE